MMIKSLGRLALWLGVVIGVLGLGCSSIMIWVQYFSTATVAEDETGFMLINICIPIPLLIMSGSFLIAGVIVRRPKFAEACLWHAWEGCKCRNCGLENHEWDGCKCLKCAEIRYQDVAEKHDLDGCVCKKCGAVFHDPVWQSDLCEQALRCTRCGLVLNKRVRHTTKWEPVATEPCKRVQRCTRCSKILKEEINHDYVLAKELSVSPCHVVEKCQRCGITREEYHHHFVYFKQLSESSTRDRTSWVDLQKCEVCGATQTVSGWDYTDW